jgi:hypothetical protein
MDIKARTMTVEGLACMVGALMELEQQLEDFRDIKAKMYVHNSRVDLEIAIESLKT